ncbi:hypothetical protein ABG79_02120 [Caloramator mitchellensis]|uniref:Uncharacterized protein n=1 Tax=Caloramator mitchellensis TaxID=908809 RepID=A0A0R3JRJ1_CALMK|nr:hypothetical protein [Caloramator mitchellensis]KRQ86086.1 hypothetical protein ABG79_02120 [Caloramator mitchellensis]
MSDYRINFGSVIGPSDTNKIYDILSILSEDDELIITMDGTDVHQSDEITKILEMNGFDVSQKGGHDDNKYHLIARRR